jgi:hypothetical protein
LPERHMTANSARMSRTHTRGKPKYERWQRMSFTSKERA